MIHISRKEDCVGCNACVQRCPKSCISMSEDEQGFLYPVVNLEKCIDCHLCENVCPVINQAEPRSPIVTYAAKNRDSEIQKSSSSGGVFFALAQRVINEGGVVFGAMFNKDWEVVHGYTETIDGVKAFQGSKYVQSRIGDSFLQVERFLKENRKVLFSGTPCQIAGLRLFLHKNYGKQLILVDIACHGVPSPLIWTKYLYYIGEETGFEVPAITSIKFRDKRNGWSRYGIRIEYVENGGAREWFSLARDNFFMQGFLKDLYIRPSCFNCPTKCGKSKSDITIADFWGVQHNYPELFRHGYYSLVLMEPEKKIEYLGLDDLVFEEVSKDIALKYNPALVKSPNRPKEYYSFWQTWPHKGIACLPEIINKMQSPIMEKVKIGIIRILEKSIGRERLIKCVDKIKYKK